MPANTRLNPNGDPPTGPASVVSELLNPSPTATDLERRMDVMEMSIRNLATTVQNQAHGVQQQIRAQFDELRDRLRRLVPSIEGTSPRVENPPYVRRNPQEKHEGNSSNFSYIFNHSPGIRQIASPIPYPQVTPELVLEYYGTYQNVPVVDVVEEEGMNNEGKIISNMDVDFYINEELTPNTPRERHEVEAHFEEEFEFKTEVEVKGVSSLIEPKSRNSLNALIESFAKFSEPSASLSSGDDIGMNLLASVAAGEMSSAAELVSVSPTVTPAGSPKQEPCTANDEAKSTILCEPSMAQSFGQSEENPDSDSVKSLLASEKLNDISKIEVKSSAVEDALKIDLANEPAIDESKPADPTCEKTADGTIVVIFDPGGGEDAATWADTGNGSGESDPHPGRNLNSSAVDMLQLADAVGFIDKFWDPLGPYLKYSLDAISLVVNKLFEPLTSLPCSLMAMDYGAGHARLQICASFTRIARAADKSRLPRMKDLASVQMLKQIEQGTGSIPGFLSHDYIAVEIVEVSVPVNEDLELSNIYGKKHEHHCRSCGRTLCQDHSSKQMALPQFGLYSNVRVCDECFNNPSRSIRDDQTSSDAIRDRFSKVNVGEDVGSKDQATAGVSASNVTDCKCGMPLCICEAPVPEPIPSQVRNVLVSSVQASTISKKAVSTPQIVDSMPKKQASSSNSKPSPFFNLSQANKGSLNKAPSDYDISGEGLREAIKGSDVNAVRKLLSEGVDANYCDKQGLTLLHLAALFNQTEIAFILMDHGAKVESKNAQGEIPLDCAPTMLQNRMRKKLEDDDKAIAQSDDQPMT